MKKALICFLFLSVCFALCAQDNRGLLVTGQNGVKVAEFNGAYALVIGESEYTSGWKRLPGVKDDVAAVKKLFEELGFQVETIENATSRNLKIGIESFLNKYGYNPDARIILYFAGHGHTLILSTNNKMGYIVPVDAPLPRRTKPLLSRAQ